MQFTLTSEDTSFLKSLNSTESKSNDMSDKAIESFAKRVVERLRDEILALVLYGSYVRGEYSKYSDVDVLVLIKSKDKKVKEIVYDIAYDIDLEYDILISLLFLTPEEVEMLIEKGSPFIENILLEGVILYDRDKTFEGIRERALKVEQRAS